MRAFLSKIHWIGLYRISALGLALPTLMACPSFVRSNGSTSALGIGDTTNGGGALAPTSIPISASKALAMTTTLAKTSTLGALPVQNTNNAAAPVVLGYSNSNGGLALVSSLIGITGSATTASGT